MRTLRSFAPGRRLAAAHAAIYEAAAATGIGEPAAPGPSRTFATGTVAAPCRCVHRHAGRH